MYPNNRAVSASLGFGVSALAGLMTPVTNNATTNAMPAATIAAKRGRCSLITNFLRQAPTARNPLILADNFPVTKPRACHTLREIMATRRNSGLDQAETGNRVALTDELGGRCFDLGL